VLNYSGRDDVIADIIGAAMGLLAFNRTWNEFK
jgi:hypothetical protein